QAYAVLSELANRAVLDDKLRLALRSRAGTFRRSYVAKERVLVTQGQVGVQLRRLRPAELDMYVKTADAAETAAVKLKGLMTSTKQEEAERKAAVELDYSRKLLDRGDRDKAKERLQDILTRYPGTRSAAEARTLLGTLGD